MPNKYWDKRFIELRKSQLDKGDKLGEELEKQYKMAQVDIQKDIDHWYNRIAKNNQISMQEAQKLLSDSELEEFKWSVDEYIKYGKENAVNQKWMKELENASAKYHISRLEAIKIQMKNHISKVYDKEEKGLSDTLKDIYSDNYYKTGYEYQKAIGVYYDFKGISEKEIEAVINKPWASDGSNFSKRIWGDHREALVKMLENDFTNCIKRGDNPVKIAKQIADNFEVSVNAAKTLVRTESAYFASVSELEAYKADGTEEYKISSALESDRTCERCKGRNSKHYPTEKYVIGSTAPPFHPNCRCTTAPYFDDKFTRYAHRGEEDKELSFKEWEKKYVKRVESGISSKYKTKNIDNAVDLNYINSDEYKNKFKNITDNKIVNASLYKYAKAILTHRNKTNKEDLCLINSKTGELFENISNGSKDFGIEYSDLVKKKIKECEPNTLISIHNHPTNNPPTGADFSSAGYRRYKLGVVCCHDGSIYTYKVGKIPFSANSFDYMVDNTVQKGYTEKEAILQTLKYFSEKYDIEWGEVK